MTLIRHIIHRFTFFISQWTGNHEMYMIENEMYMIEQQQAKPASLQFMSQWQIVGLYINLSA